MPLEPATVVTSCWGLWLRLRSCSSASCARALSDLRALCSTRSVQRTDLSVCRLSQPDVAVECSGYILEELRDPVNFEQFKKDVGEANIFIGSLIFVQVCC